MRSIWKGSISFGLVSIPIKVVSATESHSVSFHQVHTTDGGRIRYRKVCELEELEVPREEIGKGFETGDGTTVQLTDSDLAALPLPTAKTVEILGFVPAEDVDPIQLDRSYYLAGDGRSATKPYALLREALKRSGKVAVGKLAMRGRESLGLLRVYENVLALHTMLWPEEIRSVSGVAPEEDVTIREAELDLADTLMETLGELDWSELHDEYREAVEQLVSAKAEGVDTAAAGKEAAAASGKGQVVDLMAVLESSVQAARQSRGEGGGGAAAAGAGGAAEDSDATVHELSRQRGAKKTGGKAAAKAPAKRAAAKTAKTSGGKKTATRTTARTTAKATAGTPGKKATAKPAAKTTSAGKKTAGAKKTAAKTAAAKKTAGARKPAAKTAAKTTAKTAAKKTARTRKSA
ncbi:DNA repair protein [Streptomyces abyssalis]|uniref:Non-homologous end joining protein Ku n=1 Tax=Streptomyces abyssalis TaxID=933944 RepID=A0A1E7JKA6_9ACTN|nr:Ku protein [Streptomyces abyssalis]OEU88052.1 DNA repair protein [Streptomyces abyssalis]OEU90921.1 DNA repair protein [Streptomyces abyssalis]